MLIVAVIAALAAAPQAAPTPAPTPVPAPALKVLLRERPQTHQERVPRSLADLARDIKLKIPDGTPRVITNSTVKELSAGIELTTAVPSPDQASAEPPSETPADSEIRKQEWQRRYQQARAESAYWQQEVKRLDGEVKRLERDFYATDDPAQRDGVIKPAWDKALVDWRNAVAKEKEAAARPDEVLSEARRAGALPGWFRGLPEPSPQDYGPGGSAP